MTYKPTQAVARILRLALAEVATVPYAVTARWVFYRLLQQAILDKKGDYKRLLKYLSKARKQWYRGWRPDTLTDDTRAALVRGSGFRTGQGWVDALARTACNLDRWLSQATYVEIWFEAAAMTSQFQFYANENIPLLAFHGDISIPAKWDAASRLVRRWRQMRKPIHVMYYGDLDAKGLQIPLTARDDVRQMMVDALYVTEGREAYEADRREMLTNFTFTRIGLNDDQIARYNVPENPERPGTYQWEAVPDEAAQELIELANDAVDEVAFDRVALREESATDQFNSHMEGFTIIEETGDESG